MADKDNARPDAEDIGALGRGEEKPGRRPELPAGYRLVAIASDVRVLVAPGGAWVARYRSETDPWKAEIDARKHLRCEG